MPSVQKHIKALQQWWRLRVETPQSRLLKWLTWAGHEALAEEGWTLESNSRSPAFFTAFLPCGIAPPLMACQHPAHLSRLSPNTLSHGTILDLSLFLLVLFTSLISREGPVLFCSIICTHAHSFSQLLRVRSVHQALCWTLTMIISNPHNKLHRKYWSHFTDEVIETK